MPSVFNHCKPEALADITKKVARHSRLVNRQATKDQLTNTTSTPQVENCGAENDQLPAHSHISPSAPSSTIAVVSNCGTNADCTATCQHCFGNKAAFEHDIAMLQRQVSYLRTERDMLKESSTASVAKEMNGNDKMTRCFTGLQSYAIFSVLLGMLSEVIPFKSIGSGLSAADQFLLVLMKLKLATSHQYLAYRFRVHLSIVS